MVLADAQARAAGVTRGTGVAAARLLSPSIALLARNRLLEGECLSTRPLPRARAYEPELPVGERVGSFAEVDAAISRDAAYAEAQRCLRCYRLYSAVTEKPLDQAVAAGQRGNVQ